MRNANANSAVVLATALLAVGTGAAQAPKPPFPYVWARAYHILPETNDQEASYFSLCEGLDRKIYVGTAKNDDNSYLVEFDPKTEKQRIVLDANKVCGQSAKGYSAQAKIHTLNFVGPSGTIYIGSMQGVRQDPRDKSAYPGGYVITYDPASGKAENLGMPFPGQGVIDTVADEKRGLVYAVTYEEQHWMLYDKKSKKYRELGPMAYGQPSTLVDARGRAHVLTRDFQLARYDPDTDKVTVQPILVDGVPLPEAMKPSNPNWRLAADGRTAYLVLISDTRLVKIDLGGDEGQPVKATSLGSMLEGKNPDCRGALDIGPDGKVYALMRVDNATGFGKGQLHHLVRYDPRAGRMDDLGVLAVKNPDFFDFTAKGQPKRRTDGYHKLPDGTLTPLLYHMAMVVARDGTVYATIIYPFTLLKIEGVR